MQNPNATQGNLSQAIQNQATQDIDENLCVARFYIDGMSCAACSASIERALSRKDFIKSVEVNLISKSAIVKYDSTQSSEQEIFAIVSKLGFFPYKAESSTMPINPTSHNSTQSSTTVSNETKFIKANIASFIRAFNVLDKKLLPPKIRICISLFTTSFVLYLSMFPMFSNATLMFPFNIPSINIVAQIICALIVAHLGRDFYFKGFATMFAKSPTMDSLIAISTTSAFIYSLWILFFDEHLTHIVPHLYFESICVIITFVLCGKMLESSAKNQANEVINALLSRNIKNAIKLDSLHSKAESSIPVGLIKKGDLLKILPHSFIPVDGVVASGSCAIDESSLSGEVLPVPKEVDSPLFAGSLNTNQAFIMRSTSSTKDSSLSAMIALVEEVITSKPNISRIADKVASVFVPSVIIIALVAGTIWSVAKDFGFGFEIFISVLVISCPCALGLATPLAVMIGNALANKNGVFFKNAQSFEIASKVDNVVFDKTGTLTQSNLEVCEVLSFCECTKDEILLLSASIEKGSDHIIAKALIKAANKLKTRTHYEFRDFLSLAGLGIKATLDNDNKDSTSKQIKAQQAQTYALGSAKFFKQLDSSISLDSLEGNKEAICVYLGVQNPHNNKYKILGAIYLQDSIKSSALPLINALKKRDISLHILSGDISSNVARVANTLGIADVISMASPKDKLDFIKKLKNQQSNSTKIPTIMMIGDGVNDVAALQASDVSISFKEASEVSEKSADIIIYSHDLGRVSYVLDLSKAVLVNIKQNLFWAFCYNALCIPLACGVLYGFGVLLNPSLAAFAMSASSLSVVLNAQRLWRFNAKWTQNYTLESK